MSIQINSDDVLTVSVAAEELGIPKLRLYRWIKGSKVLSIEIFGTLLIPRTEVQRLKLEIIKTNEAVALD